MPSFLRELRRRSKASFKTQKSTDTSSDESRSNGNTPTSGSLTPPSILAHQSDTALNLQLKDATGPFPAHVRPLLQPALNKRYSVSGMTGLGSPAAGSRAPSLPVSQYSPRVSNINDNCWVYQKVLLVHGTIGDPTQQSLGGTLTVSRLDDAVPPIAWPVSQSHFKALVYLLPGANRLRFDFASPKLANSGTSNPIHASYLTLHMLPPVGSPPVQLAILMAKDSPETFDAVPVRAEKEGNGLETAVRKFRMAAYLWQAFTAEQMSRNRLGRRAFRFEEEWTQGSANLRDREFGQMRSEARVHLVRTDKTVAELRDLEKAQQNPAAKDKNALYDMAAEAVRGYFRPRPGQPAYVSVLLLDAHGDTGTQTITGHAAQGDGRDDLQLAVFGSHCLQSYPTSLEEVVPAFLDCTPTDPEHVAKDGNESGSSWEACSTGIGKQLHEMGHVLGLPHRDSGVMARDYLGFHRSFVCKEAYSTRTKSKGGPVLEGDECTWHRLDCLHFRSHPCFRLPNDPPLSPDASVQAWPVEGGNVLVTAATGVALVEIYRPGDDDICTGWIEYPSENGGVPRQATLTEADLRARFPEAQPARPGPLRVRVRSCGGGRLDIDDFRTLARDSATRVGNVLTGKTVYRGCSFGRSGLEGSEAQELIFTSARQRDRVLSRIVFYHDAYVDGLEFFYDDGSSQLFGKRGGKEGGDAFDMDIRRGEYLGGFAIRSGAWIDCIQVVTSLGRKSRMYGASQSGDLHSLISPRGYTVCGVSGSSGAWIDGFSVLITR